MNRSVLILNFLNKLPAFFVNNSLTNSNDGDNISDPVTIAGWEILIYTVAAFVLLLIILLCGFYCKLICVRSILSRRNAYNNLVQRGFFEKWVIRDLSVIAYNPEGVSQQTVE